MTKARRKSSDASLKVSVLQPGAESAVGVSVDELAALYVLDGIKGFGPQKYKAVHEDGVLLLDVVANPERFSVKGKRGDDLRAQLGRVTAEIREECRRRAIRQIAAAYQRGAWILTYGSPFYPARVYASNNPIPVLYVRGNLDVLRTPHAVACVGSRGLRPPYEALHRAFATTACALGAAVVSGFALGADTVGHRAARRAGGRTICCLPGGLERPFPPENKELWDDFLTYPGAVLVSEFAFGIRASALTLRKRNKLITAFADGTLISQSSAKGGAMNAYRFAREQGRPVATFSPDGTNDTSGNALIVAEQRPGDAIFPAPAEDEEAYREWLQRLSSST